MPKKREKKEEKKKKIRQTVEIDLSNLPIKETKIFLAVLSEFSEAPSKPLALQLLMALYSITEKLGLLPPFIRDAMAKKRPPDEPEKPKRKKKSRKKKANEG